MKEIPLSQGKIALVSDGDYVWLIKYKWYATKRDHTYYAVRYENINGKRRAILMHRDILGLVEGDNKTVDHKDRCGLNCQRDNLRIATYAQNNYNKKPHRDGTSKYIGLNYDKKYKVWRVRIQKEGKRLYYGSHPVEEEAAKIYNNVAKELFGEFAYLNVIS